MCDESVDMGTWKGLCFVLFHFWLLCSTRTLDVVDSSLWSDLSSDAQELEAESWSLVVDPSFCSKQEKDVIKRQDVIFGKHLKYALGLEAGWYKGKSMEFAVIQTWVQISVLSSYLISDKWFNSPGS